MARRGYRGYYRRTGRGRYGGYRRSPGRAGYRRARGGRAEGGCRGVEVLRFTNARGDEVIARVYVAECGGEREYKLVIDRGALEAYAARYRDRYVVSGRLLKRRARRAESGGEHEQSRQGAPRPDQPSYDGRRLPEL